MDISDELLRQAKKKAADQNIPLRDVVEAALRQYLGGQPKRGKYKLKWRTEGGGLIPGVDIDDRKALLDFLDESE